MKLLLTFLLAACFSVASLTAQTTFQPRKLSNDRKGVVYDKEVVSDFRLNTNSGWSFGVAWGDVKTYYLTRFYYVNFGELKHIKEFRDGTLNSSYGSYIFGKQNNFYVFRTGIGEKRYFSEKDRKKGVAVGVSYRVGPTLGLLKPYYLNISPLESPIRGPFPYSRPTKYSAQTSDDFLDKNKITGTSGFTTGWGELKPQLGGNIMGSVHFDWGAYDEFVKAMEIGIMADFYLDKVPILVESPTLNNVQNRPFFVNLFVNFQLGKRN
ncbi:MAG: hypothetical protein HC892_11045 [Saprospiraceae bacterium]|nr:hypothetical protein [Saprospiraceae bacterium]